MLIKAQVLPDPFPGLVSAPAVRLGLRVTHFAEWSVEMSRCPESATESRIEQIDSSTSLQGAC